MLPPYIGLNVGSSEIPSLLKDVRGLPCRYSIRSSHSQGERETGGSSNICTSELGPSLKTSLFYHLLALLEAHHPRKEPEMQNIPF